MDPTFIKDNFYMIMAVQAIVGLVLGLIPLLLSFRRGARNLGIIALVTSILLSLLSPLLSIIAVIIFIVLIVRKPVAK